MALGAGLVEIAGMTGFGATGVGISPNVGIAGVEAGAGVVGMAGLGTLGVKLLLNDGDGAVVTDAGGVGD